jgi:hypothetical protein
VLSARAPGSRLGGSLILIPTEDVREVEFFDT